MLERYEVTATEETPGVILDQSEGRFEFTGKSLPENANEFFDKIFSWFQAYSDKPNKKTDIVFKVDYFNSSSSRKFVEILILLEDTISKGNQVSVKWYSQKHDEMIEERGRELSAVLDIPFEFLNY